MRGRAFSVAGTTSRALAQAGEMTALLAEVVASAVRHPVGYSEAVREQMYETARLLALPAP